jgi:hypothetical protein
MRVAVALALLAFAGNTHAAAPVRGCADRADSNSANPADNPRPEDLFVGRRILLVGALGPKTWEYKQDDGQYWLKTLAVVRRGKRVTITVPRSLRARLRLNYSRGRATTTFSACNDREWTYFPGGFVYSSRGCYALDVRIHGKRSVRKRFPLGIGATCPT